jgi:hypothetical protein
VIRGTRSGRHVGALVPIGGSRGPGAAPAAAALAAALASSQLLHRVSVRGRGGQATGAVCDAHGNKAACCRPNVCPVWPRRPHAAPDALCPSRASLPACRRPWAHSTR